MFSSSYSVIVFLFFSSNNYSTFHVLFYMCIKKVIVVTGIYHGRIGLQSVLSSILVDYDKLYPDEELCWMYQCFC